MKKINVKIGKTYTLASLYYLQARQLEELVNNMPEIKHDLDLGVSFMCYTISRSFRAYFQSLPKWRIIKRLRYSSMEILGIPLGLSNWLYIKNNFPIETIKILSDSINKLVPKIPKTEKKKIT